MRPSLLTNRPAYRGGLGLGKTATAAWEPVTLSCVAAARSEQASMPLRFATPTMCVTLVSFRSGSPQDCDDPPVESYEGSGAWVAATTPLKLA